MDTITLVTKKIRKLNMVEQISQAITFPFMHRALVGGVLVAILTSWMGILVVLRQSSFFGDAIAHASLMGVALGLLLGFNPILVAAIYAVFVSFGLPYLRKHSELPIDSLLGFILPFSMGIGVILLALIPGYQPELISFLFGSILAVGWVDIVVISALAIVTFLVMLVMKNKLIFSSFDNEYAKVSGVQVNRVDAIYHILLAVTIVAGIRLVGIVLVNALLVIPASTIRLFASSLKQMFVFTPILAISVTVVGLAVSFLVNVPTGPAIAVVAGVVFLSSVVVHRL
jgi:zinc transport system permease protein